MSAMNDHARLLSSAIATSRLRLLPFLVLMYVLAFIDRANVGYARAFLQADTGLGDAAFAFGASIFFIGYACFEVPSNLMLHRLGARVWLCRIMVTWGLVSAAMMFADDAMTFYVLRFLLGVAEAGFFPGIILYLTYWFPQRSRAQALGLFYFGLPLALVLGGPLSGWLLEFHGIFGLANWQWLFVTEGLLASLVGIAAYFYLVDRPRDAGWLSDEQKRALEGELAEEDTRKQARGPHGFLSALRSGQVLKFCLVYFTIQMSVYGVVFYLPTRIASFLDGQVGLNVGRNTAGLAVIAFCFAASGFVSVQPLFWTLPTGYLSGAAAASGIALINSLGNLGGFVAPNLKTLMESQFADPRAGMFALAAVGLLGACLLARLKTSGSSSVPLRARQAG